MKLHLGCGNRHIEGFVHVDLMDYPHVDYKRSVDNLDFQEDNSADLIYASHVLDHFGRDDIERVLREWHRVLKKGGILRVAVSDFDAAVMRYLETRDLEELLGLLVGGQKDRYDFHKMIFNENLLRKHLGKAGFSEIRRYDWRKTEHADVDDFSQAYLPHMDKVNGRLMSLNLEAVK